MKSNQPDSTAVRVALWRAMHVQIDSSPHVLEDEIGLQLIAPDESWKQRPDMHPENTKLFRASIIARARFIEDLVLDQMKKGVHQYVILGAGLDTFAQRNPEVLSRLKIFEVDKPDTLNWKKKRLIEIGYEIPKNLHFVTVDFESGESWKKKLLSEGFDQNQPTVVVSTGVIMYLTLDAIKATLQELATFAKGSTLAMSYLLPMELAGEEERVGREMAEKGAKASGTPFISFFAPHEITSLALEAGFKEARNVTAASLNKLYFSNRSDGLHTSKSEELLIATT